MYLIQAKGIYNSDARRFEKKVMAIDGNRIIWIGETDKVPEYISLEAKEIDLRDKWVLPGLINTHVHLEFDSTTEVVQNYTAASSVARLENARKHARELLLSGVTTVRDAGSSWEALQLSDSQFTGDESLPRLLFCGPPITEYKDHLHFMGSEAHTPKELYDAVAKHAKLGCSSIKIMATGGQVTPGSDPAKETFTAEQMKEIVKASREYNLPTLAHCLTTKGFSNCIEAEVDCIEHSACFVRSKDPSLLERKYVPEVFELGDREKPYLMIGISTCYNSLQEVRDGLRVPTAVEKHKLLQEELLFEIVQKYTALGYEIVIGTDAGVYDTYFDETYLEIELWCERGGMTQEEVIHSATVLSATCLRMGEEIGKLQVDYLADIIAVDEDPTVNIRSFRSVPWIMKNGEIVKNTI